ncbi:MAG: glycoside hydrolase family 25 protein [Eggerthellaceae bacterium]|jgi:GH25 family lysozyme M1 (1,4-beta-N-acetylmuramidase)|nr:glycoside hydrolase family 25 protein [Eggerthellaceae bacterium]MCH4221489.1 glycoside hydrolase family 25 protein [Eggerthellaceae bacterium]
MSHSARLTVIGLVCSCLLIVLIIFSASCSALTSSTSTTVLETSPYDWSKLHTDNGHYAYYEGDQLKSKLGIDVSSFQGTIDWNAVSKDGISFAMLRLGSRGYTEGKLITDESFEQNANEANAAGIGVGAYFFSQAINEEEAEEEADFVLDNIQGTNVTYPIVYDYEKVTEEAARTDGLTDAECSACARAFCNRIQNAGYAVMIYGNTYDLQRLDQDVIDKYPIWYAEYSTPPSTTCSFEMWQYSNKGTVAGINGRVDMDLWMDTADTSK